MHLVINERLSIFQTVEIICPPWREDLSVLKSLVFVVSNHSNELVLPTQTYVQKTNIFLAVLLELVLFGIDFELELHSPLAHPAIALHVGVGMLLFDVLNRVRLIYFGSQNRYLRRRLVKRQHLMRQQILNCLVFLLGNYESLTVHPTGFVSFHMDSIQRVVRLDSF